MVIDDSVEYPSSIVSSIKKVSTRDSVKVNNSVKLSTTNNTQPNTYTPLKKPVSNQNPTHPTNLLKMGPLPIHRRQESNTTYPRTSTLPGSTYNTTSTHNLTQTPSSYQASTPSMSAAKTRQYAHLHAQLAQLNANLADTENLLRMTAVQAGDMRFLGGYVGALFMGSAKILGEEGVKGNADKEKNEVKEEREED